MCLSSVQNNLLNEHLANAKSSSLTTCLLLDLSIPLSDYHIAFKMSFSHLLIVASKKPTQCTM